MLPDGQFMTAVTGFDDRNMINQCLLYRYIISYEPYNFKGLPEDYPLTLAYGKQMDALRTELREAPSGTASSAMRSARRCWRYRMQKAEGRRRKASSFIIQHSAFRG